jgi:hypothetical protein
MAIIVVKGAQVPTVRQGATDSCVLLAARGPLAQQGAPAQTATARQWAHVSARQKTELKTLTTRTAETKVPAIVAHQFVLAAHNHHHHQLMQHFRCQIVTQILAHLMQA